MQAGFSACGVFLNRISQANKNRSPRTGLFGGSFRLWEAGQRRRSNRVDRDREGGFPRLGAPPPTVCFPGTARSGLSASSLCVSQGGGRVATRLLGPVWSAHSFCLALPQLSLCPAACGSQRQLSPHLSFHPALRLSTVTQDMAGLLLLLLLFTLSLAHKRSCLLL